MAEKPYNIGMTIAEACQLFRKDRTTIYRWCERGVLERRKIGGSVYVKLANSL